MPPPSPACLLCTYDLTGLDLASPCPECGASAAAAREVPPLTLRSWAATLALVTTAPTRALAHLTVSPNSNSGTLLVNLATSWIIIAAATIFAAATEIINDRQRSTSTLLDAAIASLPLLPIVVVFSVIIACWALAATYLCLGLPALLTAALVRARGRPVDPRRLWAISVCASYTAVPTAVLTSLITTTLCTVALVQHHTSAAARFQYTDDPIGYVLVPGAAATIAIPFLMMLWGLTLAKPRHQGKRPS